MQIQEDKPYDEINITPMLDLAYVLLVIFILMCTASVQGLRINLPKASNAPASASKPKTKVIAVANDGSLTLAVGKDIQPGTWRSVGEKVEDCYWEVSDAQGEIMDNNFISVAPQFTIQIPSDAAGFTNTGCTFERMD